MEDSQRANQEYLKARDDMKDALVQKFSYKFGRSGEKDGDQVSVASTAIRQEVDSMLVGAAAPVTEANLARLERRLRRYGGDDDAQSVFSISAYTTGSSMPRRAPSGPQSGSVSYRGNSRPITPAVSVQGSISARGSARGSVGSGRFAIGRVPRGNYSDTAYAKRTTPAPSEQPSEAFKPLVVKQLAQDVDWSTLDRLAAKLHEKDAELQRSREKELQTRLKEDLDRQMADAKLKQAREKKADKNYYDTHVAGLGSAKDQEGESKRIMREKALVIEKERNAQLVLLRARKEEEQRLAKREADELVQRVQMEDAQDRHATEQRRMMRKERVQQALQDSSVNAARRQEEMKSKLEKEDAQNEEYNQELQERSRRFKEDKANVAVMAGGALASHAEKQRAAKLKQEEVEAKALCERASKEARDVEHERSKENKLKDLKLQTQNYLFEQMQRKSDAKQQAKEEMRSLGSNLEKDAEKHSDAERIRMDAAQKRAQNHRAELERQIAQKMAPAKRDTMSVSELAMNRKLLERVERLSTAEGYCN